MAERPLLAVRSENEVFSAVRRLPASDKAALMSLAASPIHRSSVLSWTEAAWHASRQALSSVLNVAQGDGKATSRIPNLDSIAEYPTVMNIFRNNNFDVGNGRQAVFNQISRINHACVPNAQGNWNAALERFTVYAVKQIERDEEVTLSYLAETGSLKESRQGRLMNHYGFLCDCPACSGAERKDFERRRLDMQTKLHAFAEANAEREQPDSSSELEVTKELLSMYEVEGVAGREVATTYLRAAELAAKMDRTSEVSMFCEKGLRMEKDCLGTDSPIFGESLARVYAISS